MKTMFSKTSKAKSLLALLCAAAMSLAVLTGCNAQKPSDSSDSSTITSSTTAEESVTVKNADGEDVTIKSAPQRIVVLPLWEAEMVIDLIGTDRIAALSSYIDSSALSACADKASAVKGRVASEAEAIIGQKPDLVLLDTFNDSNGSLSAALKEAGITVLKLASPVTFDDIRDRLDTMSTVVFAKDKGQQLISEMNERLDNVKNNVKNVKTPAKVMYYEDHYGADGKSDGMLCAYGKQSPFEAIAKAARAVNVCTAANYSPVSKETVVNDWKPDVLIVPGVKYDANFKAIVDDGTDMIEAISKDTLLKSLPAIKNSRVAALTEKYRGSTSHYMAYAVEELAKVCYPDLFK